jgi:hypothetical protein
VQEQKKKKKKEKPNSNNNNLVPYEELEKLDPQVYQDNLLHETLLLHLLNTILQQGIKYLCRMVLKFPLQSCLQPMVMAAVVKSPLLQHLLLLDLLLTTTSSPCFVKVL